MLQILRQLEKSIQPPVMTFVTNLSFGKKGVIWAAAHVIIH